ncbi:MAG: 23S rRNA (adenine(2503)-C(2))-methyltransferase RlmN [Candidatus Bipolaricaulis sibiricus]|uniref:Probable dual-specificity RNA methyltransferase RlmN n=1 Tax=Bipolaricaulis sibiricus TaxID=2501609 RepID=A0A410FTD1_BIPS1|nr:MAG: 23S rRNA (adenine(2503)-C(2))-methyltransferase RlmN [Candidatus Bipolaricaulis sibiricus]
MGGMDPRDLLDLSRDELAATLASWGDPPFRAQQVWEWVWKHLATDFDQMTSLPTGLRARLAGAFTVAVPGVAGHRSDDQGTEKVLLRLADGQTIETVLIREDNRRTVCISTQVGCPVGCAFCATGRMGYTRDLSAGEIAAQVLHSARELGAHGEGLTHVVLMGMGEPLLNYDATLKAIRNLNEGHGFALGARRFTVSTIGVVPGIRRLAGENLQVNLAVSLHAPSDTLRRRIVPSARRWTIRDILAAADAYAEVTGRRVSYEYVLLAGVNDHLYHARALAALLRGRLAHVNLIPFNPAPGLPFQRPDPQSVDAFRRELIRRGVDATVRRSRGVDIQAGCGQLRAEADCPSSGAARDSSPVGGESRCATQEEPGR